MQAIAGVLPLDDICDWRRGRRYVALGEKVGAFVRITQELAARGILLTEYDVADDAKTG